MNPSNLIHLNSPSGLGGKEGHKDGEEASHDPGNAVEVVHSTCVVNSEFFINFRTQSLIVSIYFSLQKKSLLSFEFENIKYELYSVLALYPRQLIVPAIVPAVTAP